MIRHIKTGQSAERKRKTVRRFARPSRRFSRISPTRRSRRTRLFPEVRQVVARIISLDRQRNFRMLRSSCRGR